MKQEDTEWHKKELKKHKERQEKNELVLGQN